MELPPLMRISSEGIDGTGTYSSWTDAGDDSEGFAGHCFLYLFISLVCYFCVISRPSY